MPGGYVATASLNVEPEPLLPPLPVEESADGVHWHQLASVPSALLPIGAAEGPGATLGQSQRQLRWVDAAGFHPVLTTSAPLSDVAFVGSFGMAIGGVPTFKGGPDNQATQMTYQTTDGGRQWEAAGSTRHTAASFSQLYLVSPSVAYTTAGQVPEGANGTGYQALYRTPNGGRTWTMVLSARIDAVAITSPTTMDVSTRGVLWQSQSGGSAWQPLQKKPLSHRLGRNLAYGSQSAVGGRQHRPEPPLD
ncbi:MAG: hypothetical protein M0Z54_04460 [Thermaerobacter sp.]|nr:hypothetical protein [Thermaerobacter sp.]